MGQWTYGFISVAPQLVSLQLIAQRRGEMFCFFLLRSLRLKEARLTTFGFVSFGVSKEGDPAKAGFC